MKKEYIILVDLGILYWSNWHVMSRYSKPNELELANKIKQSINSNFTHLTLNGMKVKDIIVCADSKSFRYDIHPDYKFKQSKIQSETGLDYNLIIEYIEENYKIARREKLEADDLIFLISRYIIDNTNYTSLVMTNDGDALLLANLRCLIYNYSTRTIDTEADLIMLKLARIFIGCKSDNIQKLLPRGIGIVDLKKARYAAKTDNLAKIIKYIQAIYKIKNADVVKNIHLGIYKMNIYTTYISDSFQEEIDEYFNTFFNIKKH